MGYGMDNNRTIWKDLSTPEMEQAATKVLSSLGVTATAPFAAAANAYTYTGLPETNWTAGAKGLNKDIIAVRDKAWGIESPKAPSMPPPNKRIMLPPPEETLPEGYPKGKNEYTGINLTSAPAYKGGISRDDLNKMSDKDFIKFSRSNYDDFGGGNKMAGVGFVQMADKKGYDAKGIGPVTRVIESEEDVRNRQMPNLTKEELAAAVELAKIHEQRGVSRDQISMYQQAQLDAKARDDKFALQKNWENMWMRPTKDPITGEEKSPDIDAAIIHSLRYGDEIPEQWHKSIPIIKERFQNFAREFMARKTKSGKTNAEIIKERGGSLNSPEVQDAITRAYLENPNRRW